MIKRKTPMRMCVGCREMKPKSELIRVVRSPEGAISIDRKGKASGRGAYICPLEECFEKARKTRGLQRQLECEITPEVFESLETEVRRRIEM